MVAPPEVEPTTNPNPAPIATPPPAPPPEPAPAVAPAPEPAPEPAPAVAAAPAVAPAPAVAAAAAPALIAEEPPISQCETNYADIFNLLKTGTYNGVPVNDLSLNKSQLTRLLKEVKFAPGITRERRSIFGVRLDRLARECALVNNPGFEPDINNILLWINFFVNTSVPVQYNPFSASPSIDQIRPMFTATAPPPTPAAPAAPAAESTAEQEAELAPLVEQVQQETEAESARDIATSRTFETWLPVAEVESRYTRLREIIRGRYGRVNITDDEYRAADDMRKSFFKKIGRGYRVLSKEEFAAKLNPISSFAEVPVPSSELDYVSFYIRLHEKLGNRRLTQEEYDRLGADWVKEMFKKENDKYALVEKATARSNAKKTVRAERPGRNKTFRNLRNVLRFGRTSAPAAPVPAPAAPATPPRAFVFPERRPLVIREPTPPAPPPVPVPGAPPPPGVPVAPRPRAEAARITPAASVIREEEELFGPTPAPTATVPPPTPAAPGAGTGLVVEPPVPAPDYSAQATELARTLNENLAARQARLASTTIGGPLPTGNEPGLPTQPRLTAARGDLVGLPVGSRAGTIRPGASSLTVRARPPSVTFNPGATRLQGGRLRKKTFKSRRGKKTNVRGTRRRKDRANRSHSHARRRT